MSNPIAHAVPTVLFIEFATMMSALTTNDNNRSVPPSVSVIGKRFNTTLHNKDYIQFGNIFNPALRSGTSEKYLDLLCSSIVALCSVTNMHFFNGPMPPTSETVSMKILLKLCDTSVYYLQEMTNEQELFATILQTLVPVPNVIRAQVKTVLKPEKSPQKIPMAKFDLVSTRLKCDFNNEEPLLHGLISLGSDGKEEAVGLVSSKMDSSFRYTTPSMSNAWNAV